jgi:hypothetical protein
MEKKIYFRKFKIQVPIIPIDDFYLISVARSFSTESDSTITKKDLVLKKIIGETYFKYFDVSPKIKEIFINFFPEELRKYISSIELQVSKAEKIIAPHIDNGRITAINFYYKVSDEITNFYSNINNHAPLIYNGASIYLEQWLLIQDSFIAKENDIVVLDVSCIHGLSNLIPNNYRISISIGFNDLNISQVCDILYKYNFIPVPTAGSFCISSFVGMIPTRQQAEFRGYSSTKSATDCQPSEIQKTCTHRHDYWAFGALREPF